MKVEMLLFLARALQHDLCQLFNLPVPDGIYRCSFVGILEEKFFYSNEKAYFDCNNQVIKMSIHRSLVLLELYIGSVLH